MAEPISPTRAELIAEQTRTARILEIQNPELDGLRAQRDRLLDVISELVGFLSGPERAVMDARINTITRGP